jgi:mannosidase alpha-like ER degradation enhancer 1
VRPGHIVYINDSSIFAPPSKLNLAQNDLYNRDRDVDLQFFATQAITPQATLDPPEFDVVVNAFSAFFGADLSQPPSDLNGTVALFNDPVGLRVYQDRENEQGCLPYSSDYANGVIVAHRGTCTFLEKLKNAHDASAVGLLIISNEDLAINPTASAEDLEDAAQLSDIALVLLTKSTGKALLDMIDAIEDRGTSQVMVTLHKPRIPTSTSDPAQDPLPADPPVQDNSPKDTDERILYINNHALLNTRLLV